LPSPSITRWLPTGRGPTPMSPRQSQERRRGPRPSIPAPCGECLHRMPACEDTFFANADAVRRKKLPPAHYIPGSLICDKAMQTGGGNAAPVAWTWPIRQQAWPQRPRPSSSAPVEPRSLPSQPCNRALIAPKILLSQPPGVAAAASTSEGASGLPTMEPNFSKKLRRAFSQCSRSGGRQAAPACRRHRPSQCNLESSLCHPPQA